MDVVSTRAEIAARILLRSGVVGTEKDNLKKRRLVIKESGDSCQDGAGHELDLHLPPLPRLSADTTSNITHDNTQTISRYDCPTSPSTHYHGRSVPNMPQDQMFPHPRRIVTGHDTSGNSIVVKDSQIPCLPVRRSLSLSLPSLVSAPSLLRRPPPTRPPTPDRTIPNANPDTSQVLLRGPLRDLLLPHHLQQRALHRPGRDPHTIPRQLLWRRVAGRGLPA